MVQGVFLIIMLDRIRIICALFLWASGLVAIFVSNPGLDDLRLAILVPFIALAVTRASRITLFLVGTAVIGTILWLVETSDVAPLITALRFSLVFAIFLPVLVLIRETLEVSPEINQARNAFGQLSRGDRSTGLVIGSQLLGVVLTLGVMAMTAPLIKADSPEPVRRDAVMSVLRGLMLGGLWTPFSVAVVYVLNFKPNLSLIHLSGPGFLVASIGTIGAVIAGAGLRGLVQIPRALRIFAPLMPSILVSIAAVVAFNSLTTFSTIQSVALVMPTLCLIKLSGVGIYAGRQALGNLVRKVGNTGNELLLFAAAVTLGALLRESGVATHIVTALALDTMSAEMAILVLMMLGPILSLAGLHSILVGTILFALLGPLDDRLPDIIEAHIVICGWMCGSILSFGSLSLALGTGLFRVSVPRIVLSSNLPYVFAFMFVTAFVFMAWRRMII